MLSLLCAALALAAPVETILIPGSTVYFDLVEIPASKATRPFRISRTEVTWAEYNLYADSFADEKLDGITRPSQPDVSNPRDPFPDGTVQTGRHPARSIGMYGALGYCAWLSKKTGRRFRLPTEAEWRAAAGASVPVNSGWHTGNSGGHTNPVGSLPANRNGLFDATGNVAELCLEPFQRSGAAGVVRGGSWRTPAKRLKPELREPIDMDAWQEDDPKRPIRDWWFSDAPFVGFRLVAPEDDGATELMRTDTIRRIVIEDVRVADSGTAPRWIATVTGQLRYTDGPALSQVEIEGCFMNASGELIRNDPRGKPAFGLAWPVLASSAHRDGRERDLTCDPINTLANIPPRRFTVLIPLPFDEVGPVPVGEPVVKATWVRFAR